jgi:transposase
VIWRKVNPTDQECLRKSRCSEPQRLRENVKTLQRPLGVAKVLHAKIGDLTLENDFLVGALSKAGLLSAKR